MRPMPYKDPIKKRERHRVYMQEVWYPKNKSKHIGYQKVIKAKITNYVFNFKKRGKCSDCGFLGSKFPDVLDFDHVRGDKKFNISEFKQYTSSLKRVQEEIEKCEMVCANCHRIRTAIRKRRRSSGS